MKTNLKNVCLVILLILTVAFAISCDTENEGTDPEETNHSPYDPASPSPSDGATNVSINANLSWTGGDPDADDTIYYDVYFEDIGNPERVSDDQLATTYEPGQLEYNTTYYWHISAKDNHNSIAYGGSWSFTTEDEPTELDGIFAELVVGRMVYNSGGEPYYTDLIVARFDSAFAPCSTITALQADTVRCNQYELVWQSNVENYAYQDPEYAPFIELGQDYIFQVVGSSEVPSLIDTIAFPECAPYVTNISYEDTLSFSGFEVNWSDYCGGTVRFIIMSKVDSTGVDFTTTNDGSHYVSAGELDAMNDVAGYYMLIMIFQNTESISATGYDSSGYIWARTINTTNFYIE